MNVKYQQKSVTIAQNKLGVVSIESPCETGGGGPFTHVLRTFGPSGLAEMLSPLPVLEPP